MGPFNFKWKSLTYLCVLSCLTVCQAGIGDETHLEDELTDDDSVSVTNVDSEFDIEYITPTPSGPVHFAENFDDYDQARKRWISSRAQKEEQDNVFKYDGQWEFELPQRQIFAADRALVLRSKAKHAAISAKLNKKFEFNTKPFLVQYEVNFQNGMDCGGAYIKLLSYSKDLQLDKFHDKTPYTIMFGPDKCGSDIKMHFIFRHKNPINGSFEEKHAKKPSNRLEENFSDKKPHVYRLKLTPDNRYEVIVDGRLINSGSLLEDMEPSVNPPMEIEDPNDRKPADWDEREKIADPTATKPADWDEEAPPKIPDSSAEKPENWLVDENEMIPDLNAKKPEDWDESMDGIWEPPLLSNPACEGAIGCGPWSPPMIDNPSFKGKWKAPMISNPNYKGKWHRRMIANPGYFEDKEPFKMTSIGAVGLEIWTMTDLVLFDNFIITDDEQLLDDWTSQSYDLKRRALDRDSRVWYGRLLKRMNYRPGAWLIYFIYCLIPILVYIFYLYKFCEKEGVISRIINYSNAHPWLWAIYIFVIGLPLVLFFTFCCGSSQDKKVDDARHKKTDEITADDEPEADLKQEKNDTKNNTTKNKPLVSPPGKNKVGMSKDQLEKPLEDTEDEDKEEDDKDDKDDGEEEEAEESSIEKGEVEEDSNDYSGYANLEDSTAEPSTEDLPKKRRSRRE